MYVYWGVLSGVHACHTHEHANDVHPPQSPSVVAGCRSEAPSGISSIGVSTPQSLDLRKKSIEEAMEQTYVSHALIHQCQGDGCDDGLTMVLMMVMVGYPFLGRLPFFIAHTHARSLVSLCCIRPLRPTSVLFPMYREQQPLYRVIPQKDTTVRPAIVLCCFVAGVTNHPANTAVSTGTWPRHCIPSVLLTYISVAVAFIPARPAFGAFAGICLFARVCTGWQRAHGDIAPVRHHGSAARAH